MAPPAGTMRVSRYFTALALVLGVLYLIVFLPGTANTPKLGIDLVGGIRVIFTANAPGGQQVTSTAMEQARQIIEDRINGTGVTASTVQVQGDDQLVVSIPGGTDTDVRRLGQAAQLNFRPLIAPAIPVTCDPAKKDVSTLPSAPSGSGAASGSPSGSTPSGSASGSGGTSAAPSGRPSSTGANAGAAGSSSAGTNDAGFRELAPGDSSSPAAPSSKAKASTPASSPAATPSTAPANTAPAQAARPCTTNILKDLKTTVPTLPVTEQQYAALSQTQQTAIQNALTNMDCDSAIDIQQDKPKQAYVACSKPEGGVEYAYLLGQVIVPGTQIDEADAVAPSTGGQGGSTEWTVSLTLKDSGKKAWGDWTTKHNTGRQNADPTQCSLNGQFPCNDFVGFTLDGRVLSAPATNEAIVGQATQISGSFVQSSANALADSLKYGALPLNFDTSSNERVSASLGTSQLKAAFLAGGIGLVLVVLYSLLYYRGLGLVTIASLIVSGLLTYAMMVILGQQIGFTLDLAGITGLIVALGITADSFVVFFERIKDEVHEGRSVRVAVPRGWVRARRTVISADVVSFLAAVILYIFASADVKGFAFTLGLSTVLDLFVVVVFTHPMVAWLSRFKTFGSARFSGLASVREGGITESREVSRGKLAARRRAAGSTASTSSISPSSSTGTAVLDRDDDAVEDGDPDAAPVSTSKRRRPARKATPVVEDPTSEVDDEPVADDEPVTDDDVDTSDEDLDDTPRRKTTPEAGSAAERAAARRARMREQREKGDR
ncbi:preprotein translocase subunit SecD [Jatrophihabitans fulvus]